MRGSPALSLVQHVHVKYLKAALPKVKYIHSYGKTSKMVGEESHPSIMDEKRNGQCIPKSHFLFRSVHNHEGPHTWMESKNRMVKRIISRDDGGKFACLFF